MRTIAAAAAIIVLGLTACARESTERAGAEDSTQHQVVEAGQAVREAAVEVGQAARLVIEDTAEAVEENVDQEQAPPAQPSPAEQPS